MDLASETAKYAFPRRFESSNLEEALMSGTPLSISLAAVFVWNLLCLFVLGSYFLPSL